MNVEKLLTRETILQARNEYLEYNVTPPEQFNIQYSKSNGWRCEFNERKGNWRDCTLWLSGDKVIDIFFMCDPEDVFKDTEGWDEEYNEE